MVRNEYPRAVEFLEGAMRKRNEISRMRGRLDALRTASTNITAKVSDMPRPASPNVQRFEDMMLKIVDLEKEIQEAAIVLAEIKADITLKITEWLDDAAVEIMILRYVECMQWSEIASEIGQTDRSVYRLHRAALPVVDAALSNEKIVS